MLLLEATSALVLGGILFLYALFKIASYRRRFFGRPPSFPLGHLQDWDDLLKANELILRDSERFLTSSLNEPISQFMFYKESVAVLNPKHVDEVFKHSVSRKMEPYALNKIGLYHIEKFMGKFSVGVAEGNEWKDLRKKIGNSLRGNYIRSLLPEFQQCFSDVAERMKTMSGAKKQAIDVNVVAHALTLDIVCLTVFRERFGAIEAFVQGTPNDAVDAFSYAANEMARRTSSKNPLDFWYGYLPFSVSNAKLRRSHFVIQQAVGKIIEKRLNNPDKQNEEDLVKHFLEMSSPSPSIASPETKQLLCDNILTMMWAGHDTTAASLSAAIYLLASHPEIQRELRDSLISEGATPLTADLIANNARLDAVCWETLRLHPPAIWTNRGLTEDLSLNDGDILLKKGSQVFFPIWAIHRSKVNWREPDLFLPFERFIDNRDGVVAKNKGNLIPFGGGNRICPGNQLAIFEFKTLLALFVTKFQMNLPQNQTPRQRFVAVGMFQALENNLIAFSEI